MRISLLQDSKSKSMKEDIIIKSHRMIVIWQNVRWLKVICCCSFFCQQCSQSSWSGSSKPRSWWWWCRRSSTLSPTTSTDASRVKSTTRETTSSSRTGGSSPSTRFSRLCSGPKIRCRRRPCSCRTPTRSWPGSWRPSLAGGRPSRMKTKGNHLLTSAGHHAELLRAA